MLCFAAESVATDCQREQLSYVIGTEVPVPGGEASAIQSVHITHVEDAANTLRTHQKAFIARGLTEALTRVIAIVVQPGVEFDHSNIIHYQPQEAQPLAQWIENTRMFMKHILRLPDPDGLLGISPRSLCNIESRSRINLCFTRGDICTGTN